MNTLATLDIAHTEQEARVQHALHVRAIKAYRREHRAPRPGRERIAAVLRRLATRLDGRAAVKPAPRPAASVRRLSTH